MTQPPLTPPTYLDLALVVGVLIAVPLVAVIAAGLVIRWFMH